MQLDDAHTLALELMTDHELTDWRFKFDHARQRLGACHYPNREISLSRHFVRLNDASAIAEVLKHEIAHALAGPGHGHDSHWQKIARHLGVPARACAPESTPMPQPKWAIVCTGCDSILALRHRRSLDLSTRRCPHCGLTTGLLKWQAGHHQLPEME